jgi:3',5'-cyclic AMP phosphodiesterase CpdA
MQNNTTFAHLTDLHIATPEVAKDNLFSNTASILREILSEIKTLTPRPASSS